MPDDAKKDEWVPSFMIPRPSDQPPPPPPWRGGEALSMDKSGRILWDKKASGNRLGRIGLYRARKALAVAAWLIVALVLASIGVGSDKVMGAFVGVGNAVRGGLVGAGH